jgi:protease YdgD
MMRLLSLLWAMTFVVAAPAFAQDDSCEYAFDNECDDEQFGGSGACPAGSDTFDCAILATGRNDDSCDYSRDGECDEPRYDGEYTVCRDGSDTTDCTGLPTRAEALEALFALLPDNVRQKLGDDTCQYAFDLECDDSAFGGTGACDTGTDATDCRAFAAGGDDSCRYAQDNECDEPGIGTGVCGDGTDTGDCGDVAYLRGRDDSCNTAFNGTCEEPGIGSGQCANMTDTADCMGRGRPAEALEHYFGRDDRFLVDSQQMPWRAVGLLSLAEGGTCTASLVGPRTLLTAAHCVTFDAETVSMPISFQAGLSRGQKAGKALVVDAYFSSDYTLETAGPGEGNGADWAIVTLDRDLGNVVGWLNVHILDDSELAQIGNGGLLVDQAGYSRDTGMNLSGNRGCRVTVAYPDSSILHECDTTFGDSGSPFLVRVGDEWQIIAIESTMYEAESKTSPFPSGSLAVDSRAFGSAVRRELQ